MKLQRVLLIAAITAVAHVAMADPVMPKPLPRVAPLPVEQWTPEMKKQLGDSRETILSRGGAANMPATFAQHSRLFEAWSGFMKMLTTKGALPDRARELAVMRTAWLVQSPLVWVTHASPAQQVGITKTEVEQVIVGPSDTRWAPQEHALLQAVDAFYNTGDMSDQVWQPLREHYDEKQIMELMMLIANYRMVAQMVQTMRVDLGDQFPGLHQR